MTLNGKGEYNLAYVELFFASV